MHFHNLTEHIYSHQPSHAVKNVINVAHSSKYDYFNQNPVIFESISQLLTIKSIKIVTGG